jgi:NADP-dependent 3-hydroxy acid dehydrogenase YdfG
VVATDVGVDGLAARALDGLVDAAPRLEVHALDVTDVASVARATGAALAGGAVDVLVNNGGYAVFGSAAEADLTAIARMFDANVLGVARVTQALLPSLRAVAGTVVQISSVAGRMAFPESGFYAATKHAVEALSEALFEENCTFGLRVVVIEPGHFATGFQERAARESRPRDPSSAYAALHPLWDRRRAASLATPPQDPERVAAAIEAGIHDPRPFLRVVVGDDAPRILALREALGHDGWVHFMANRYGGLPQGADPFDPIGVPASPGAGLAAAVAQGHAEHWAESEAGAAAVRALRGDAG